MPDAAVILAGLYQTANEWRFLAVFWHAYFAVLGIILLCDIRLPHRITGVLLTLPLFSVGLLAWNAENPFNATVFILVGFILIVLSTRPGKDIRPAPFWMQTGGMVMFVHGWIYPHFIEADSLATFLYAAPTGLIPCPTISIMTGLALIQRRPWSGAWSSVLAITGIFYGLFGAVYLDVALDWMLFAGALILLLFSINQINDGLNAKLFGK